MAELEIKVKALSADAIRGLSETQRALEKTVQETGKLDVAMGTAGNAIGGLVNAAAGLVAAQVTIGRMVNTFKEVARAADEAHDSALGFGVATDKFTEQAYALKLAGAEASALEMAYRGLANTAEDALRDPGSKIADRFRELKIAITDLNGELRPVDQLFADVVGSLGGMSSATERAAVASELLRVRGTSLNAVIAGGSAEFKKAIDAAQLYGASLSPDITDKADRLGDAMLNFKTAVKATFLDVIPLALQFAEALEKGAAAWRRFSSGEVGFWIFEARNKEMQDQVSFQEQLRARQTALPQSVQSQLQLQGAAVTPTESSINELVSWLKRFVQSPEFTELPRQTQTEFSNLANQGDLSWHIKQVESLRVAFENAADLRAVIEAENKRAQAAKDGAAAILAAAAAERDRISTLELMLKQGSFDVKRPQLEFGTNKPISQEDFDRQQRIRGLGPVDIVQGQPTGPGGIPTEDQRKEADRAWKEQQEAFLKAHEAMVPVRLELNHIADAFSALNDVGIALKNTTLQLIASFGRLAVSLIETIRDLQSNIGSIVNAGASVAGGAAKAVGAGAEAVVQVDEQALGRSIVRGMGKAQDAGAPVGEGIGTLPAIGEVAKESGSSFGKMLTTFGKVAAVTVVVAEGINLLRDALSKVNNATRESIVLSRQQLQSEFSGQGDISPQIGQIMRMGNRFEATPAGVGRIGFGTNLGRMGGVSNIWFPRRGLDVDTSQWDAPLAPVGFGNVSHFDQEAAGLHRPIWMNPPPSPPPAPIPQGEEGATESRPSAAGAPSMNVQIQATMMDTRGASEFFTSHELRQAMQWATGVRGGR